MCCSMLYYKLQFRVQDNVRTVYFDDPMISHLHQSEPLCCSSSVRSTLCGKQDDTLSMSNTVCGGVCIRAYGTVRTAVL
jgi:hypothetical protein